MTADIAINWNIAYYLVAAGFLTGFASAALFMIYYLKQNGGKW